METLTITKRKYQSLPKKKSINPNIPSQLTNMEWRDYFEKIEQGTFTDLETSNNDFNEWKQDLLLRKL